MKKTELIHNNPFSPLLFCDAKVLRYLNILGVALIAVSLLYLMAANWWMLPKFVKLFIPQILLLGSALLSVRFTAREKLRQSLDTVSGLMLGLSLAVIGQIYQTGADSYQLFLLGRILGSLHYFVWSASWRCILILNKAFGWCVLKLFICSV